MFYLDSEKCTSPTCKICYTDGPTWFAVNTKAYIKHQPLTSEVESVRQIANRCPVGAITERENAGLNTNSPLPSGTHGSGQIIQDYSTNTKRLDSTNNPTGQLLPIPTLR